MHYVGSKLEEQKRAKTYQVYIAEGIRAIANNTAKFAGGYELNQRYLDLIDRDNAKADARSGGEVIEGMKQRLKALSEENEE